MKTKSGSSAWGGYDFCWTLAAQADPLGSWAAGQQASRAGLHGRQRGQRAQRNVRLPF